MRHVGRQYARLLRGMLVAGLILVACSPDAPVSGQPGQAAGPAAGSLVQGQVADTDGKPVTEVIVVPHSTDTPPQAVPEKAVFTNEQGRYQWTLPAGRYTLTFTKDGYAPVTEAVIIVPDQPATLDVVLQQL